MQSTFFVLSEKRNTYLVNIQKKNVLLIHPYIPFVYFQNQMAEKELPKEDFEYYQKKIAYYKQYGIISETPVPSNEQLYLSPELIEESLSNIKQVVFETTEKCNLKCKYCYYGEYYDTDSGRQFRDMPVEIAKKTLEYVNEKQLSQSNKSWNNSLYVSFFGGEPLMNTGLIEKIIKNIKFTNRKIIYSMTTNATLLHKYIPLLVNNNIQIMVSLDGNAEHNAYRVFHNDSNSFDRIISNLNILQQQYPEYFKKYVTFNAVLHNKNSVQEIHDFFKNTFEKEPNIAELNDSGISDEKTDTFYATYRNKRESLMQSENYERVESELFLNAPSFHSALIFLHQYLQFVYKSYEDLLKGENRNLLISTGTCVPFSKKMFITADGKILPCEKIAQKYALGKVDKNGVSLNYTEIADKYNTYYKVLSKQCSVCYRQQACNQCVFFLENLEDKPECHGFMDKNSMQKYLINTISFFENHPHDYSRMMKDVIIS